MRKEKDQDFQNYFSNACKAEMKNIEKKKRKRKVKIRQKRCG